MRLSLDTSVYSLDTVKKAAYRLSDRVAIDFYLMPDEIVCDLSFPRSLDEDQQAVVVAEFRTELLDQDLRERIGRETQTMRNAILAVAFSPVTSQSE